MYSLVLWGKKGKTFSILESTNVTTKKGVTRARWESRWLQARIIIQSGILNNV